LSHLLNYHYGAVVSNVLTVLQPGELWFMFWLLIKGATPTALPPQPTAVS
jgi:hypothetical protein